MALIDKETIRKEIERQRQFIEELFTEGDNSFYDGQDDAYCYILTFLAFLDSIQEQPVIKKSNALFDECVKNCDPAIMKEVSDNIDQMLGRQPVEGLEKEIHDYMFWLGERDSSAGILRDRPGYMRIVEKVARHFAEWGAEHLK